MESLYEFNDSFRQYDYASRALMAVGLMLASAAYLHLSVRRLAPSLRALLAVVPLLVLNTWIPLMFDSRTELLTRLVSSLGYRGHSCCCGAVAWPPHQPVPGSRCCHSSTPHPC